MTEVLGAPLPLRPGSFDELEALVGAVIGPTRWQHVIQEQIDAFAAATGDDLWIHTDPERAATGAQGTTIAHGLYSLSLGPQFMSDLLSLDAFSGLSYGYDRVRFPTVVPVVSRVRMTTQIESVKRVPGGIQLMTLNTVELQGASKPACVSRSITRLFEP